MAVDPGQVVREGLEALGIPELHSFLLRLGVDGRGLSPDNMVDIALEALDLRPRLVESAWMRANAGAPVPARSGRPWDAGAFALRLDVAQPAWPPAGSTDGSGGGSECSFGDAGGLRGTGSTSGTDVSDGRRSAHSRAGSGARSYDSGLSGDSAGGSGFSGDSAGDSGASGRGASPLPHGGSQIRAEYDDASFAMQERIARLEAMLTPEARYEYMAQVACEPPMRHILAGKMSEADIRKVRAYVIDDASMDKLVEYKIVPPGFPHPDVLFSDGAFRLDEPVAEQLPMPALQRDLIKQHLSVPVGWPERATHYSNIDYDEFRLYEPKDKRAVEEHNDDVQGAMWELRDIIYVSFTLVDESRALDERVDAVLRFLEVQSRLLYDDIAHAEAGKKAISDTYVGGGLKVQKRSADNVQRVGPSVTSDARRAELAAQVASQSAINAARVTYAAAASKGVRTDSTAAAAKTAAGKAKKDAADAKRAADKRTEKAKKATPKSGDAGQGGKGQSKMVCFACGKTGHQHNQCKNKPAGWTPSTPPAAAADADKPARVNGSEAAASPSHESSGYVPGSRGDPPSDQAARAANRASDRRINRPAGGQ